MNLIKNLIISITMLLLIILMGNICGLNFAEIFLASSFCIAGQYLSKLFMYVLNGGRIM